MNNQQLYPGYVSHFSNPLGSAGQGFTFSPSYTVRPPLLSVRKLENGYVLTTDEGKEYTCPEGGSISDLVSQVLVLKALG